MLAAFSTAKVEAREYYRQVRVGWTPVTGADHYNIYYRETTETKYDHAVRDLPASMTEYTIAGLRTNVGYIYNLAAVDNKGVEFAWSGERRLAPGATRVYGSQTYGPQRYNKATISWDGVAGAEYYYIYYRKVGENRWTHAVRDLRYDARTVTIARLDKVGYEYQVVAVRNDKTEFWWSEVRRMAVRSESAY